MKKLFLISACAISLSASGAFAQSTSAPAGVASEGNVKAGTSNIHGSGTMDKDKGVTTGSGATSGVSPGMANSSSEGNVGPGTNNNSGKQPAGR